MPTTVWFRYSPTRHSKHLSRHLAHFKGFSQADAFAGFNGLYARQRDPLVEIGCWAHVRRKFYDLHAAHGSPLAKQALERIGALYRIEDGVRGRPPKKRRAARQARAGPLLDELHAWLEAIYATLSKKSGLAQAIRYALARWPALPRYRDDGRLEIDTNAAERALRAGSARTQELSVCRFRRRRRTGRGHLHADRYRKVERSRPASAVTSCA